MKKAEQAHVDKVAALGCIACYVMSGMLGTPAEIHHVRHGQGYAQRASWFKVLPLCPDHHRNGEHGKIAIHKARRTFEAEYGTETELLTLTNSLI